MFGYPSWTGRFSYLVGLDNMATKPSVRHILEGTGAFDGTNFSDWEMNIRIVLGHEHLLYVLDRDVPPEPPIEDIFSWQAWSKQIGRAHV